MTTTELQEEIWELLLRLAESQYSAGKHKDPSGDQFSKVITPFHTQLMRFYLQQLEFDRIADYEDMLRREWSGYKDSVPKFFIEACLKASHERFKKLGEKG